ncbi:MAG: hypothetical protein JWP90_683, partial [Mycetocola sp.]|nr:hypothetical protein [Mycetocola sp.]
MGIPQARGARKWHRALWHPLHAVERCTRPVKRCLEQLEVDAGVLTCDRAGGIRLGVA